MAILTVERGEDEGKSYTIMERAHIGRNPEAEVPILDFKASRRHCVIFRNQDRYFIEDMGSRNGTALNGELIEETKALREDDLIRIGLTWFRFVLQDDQGVDLQNAFEHYEILDQLGQGGMGTIFTAVHIPLDRQVAIKILPPKMVRDNPSMRKLFLQEAAAISLLSHENIAMMLDFGVCDPYIYFTMELIEGVTLEDYISLHGRLDLKEMAKISLQIARGLHHAHRKNLVHRDVKPRNIMLNKNKKAKIIDFGLATVLAEISENTMTSAGAIGTLEYISPEQAQNEEVDERSDIYSLGVSMYEMLAGSTPYQGDTPYTLIHKHINVVPPKLDSLDREIPKDLIQIVDRCLEKAPEDRYHNCSELIRDLEKFFQFLKDREELEKISSQSKSGLDQVVFALFAWLGNPLFTWTVFPLAGLILAILLQYWI